MRNVLRLLAVFMTVGAYSSHLRADEWVKPVPAAAEFQYEDTLYLYNLGAKGYYSDEGGYWGTQATLSDNGIKVYLQQYIDSYLTPPDSVWDGKTLVFFNYSTKHKKWVNLFIDSANSMYIDHTTQPNWFWQMDEQGDNVYRIYGAERNPSLGIAVYPDSYMGYDLNTPSDKGLKPLLDITSGELAEKYCVDWIFVTPEEYVNNQAKLKTYRYAMSLKAKLDEAAEAGISVPEAEKVYQNTSSTDEELLEAIDAVAVAVRENIEKSASVDSPLDMASKGYLVNPTFDSDTHGWLTNTGAQNSKLATNKSDGVSLIGNAWENWNKTAFSGKMYQLIASAPHGVYKFVLGVYSDSNRGTYVYASKDSTEVIGTAPQTLEMYTIFDGDTLELGVKKSVKVGGWIQIDNAALTYYGNDVESYKFWIDKVISNAPDFENVYVQHACLEEYNKVISDIQQLQTKEEIIASEKVFLETLDKVQANADAYAAYAAKLEEARKTADETSSEMLGDYIMDVVEPAFEACELSTEEVIAATSELEEMILKAKAESVTEGEECTQILDNNDFRDGLNGWTVDKNASGTPKVGGTKENPCVELFQGNFDMYQDIAEIPDGVYRLEVPAFYRTEGNLAAYNSRETAEIKTFLYINNESMPVANVMNEAISGNEDGSGNNIYDSFFETPDGTFTPNGMNSASTAFANGKYKNTLYGVVTDGKMHVGIRSNGTLKDRWSCWGKFRIYYEGYNSDVISGMLNPLIDEARKTLESNFAPQERTELENWMVLASNSVSTSTDGKALLDIYLSYKDIKDTADASISVYNELMDRNNELASVIDETAESASESAKAFAAEVYDKVNDGYTNQTFATVEADSMTRVVLAAMTKLRMPDEVASDASPVDASAVIVNADFDNDDNVGWSGSAAAHQTYGNAEFYHTNFDMYQIIYGLPDGTYKVSVDGFFRSGHPGQIYPKYLEDQSTDTINAFVYAESNGKVSSVPFKSILEGVRDMAVNGGSGEYRLSDGKYLPNTMQTTKMYMELGYFLDNSVICEVKDGYLKIGIKKDVLRADDWVVIDHWQLEYYGDASEHNPDGDASGIESVDKDVTVVSKTYYTIGGVMLDAPVKGINIVKQVMSDGSVKYVKVLVK